MYKRQHQRLSTGYYALRPVASTGANPYVLNINTNTKNCNLWAINQLPPEDYSIRFAHEGGDLRGVILIHRALALTVSAENMPAGGYNVKWEPSTGLPSTPTANPQIWDCFPEAVSYTHLDVYKRQTLLLTKGNMSGEEIMNLFVANKFSVPANVLEELLDLEEGILSSKAKINNLIEFPAK